MSIRRERPYVQLLEPSQTRTVSVLDQKQVKGTPDNFIFFNIDIDIDVYIVKSRRLESLSVGCFRIFMFFLGGLFDHSMSWSESFELNRPDSTDESILPVCVPNSIFNDGDFIRKKRYTRM